MLKRCNIGQAQLLWVLGVLLALQLVNANAASAERRVALVIGNSAYAHTTPLPNTANDANDIATSLTRLGFDVNLYLDLDGYAMQQALHKFSRRARGADMALIYFAGHGIEVGKQNYLIPTDAQLRTNSDVDFEAVSLDLVMRAVGNAKGLRLVLLDACRNNPFASSMKIARRSRAVGRGFSRVEPEAGTLVGYAAREGTTADDGEGRNSPYAKALLAHLEQPGLELNLLFRKVRDQVLEETNGDQEPFTYGSLPGNQIYLKSPDPLRPKISDAKVREQIAWGFVKDAGNLVMLRNYVKKFPDGEFRKKADGLIRQLEIEEAARERAIAAQRAREDAKRQEQARLRELEKQRREKLHKARIEVAWLQISLSNDVAELEGFIARYPDSPHVKAARARIASLAGRKDQVAVSPRSVEPPPVSEAPEQAKPLVARDPHKLVMDIQRELNRVGCNAGRADGKWGRGSRRALRDYARHGKVKLASLDPTPIVLDRLNGHGRRVCPLTCGRGEVAEGGRCVLKKCARGKQLNRKGTCVASLDSQARKKQLKCSRRHRLRGNRCVLKRCGRGKELDRRGRCVAKRQDRKKITKIVASNSSKKKNQNQCGRCHPTRHKFGAVIPTTWPRVCGDRFAKLKAKGKCL